MNTSKMHIILLSRDKGETAFVANDVEVLAMVVVVILISEHDDRLMRVLSFADIAGNVVRSIMSLDFLRVVESLLTVFA